MGRDGEDAFLAERSEESARVPIAGVRAGGQRETLRDPAGVVSCVTGVI